MDKIVVLGTGTALVTKYFNTCFALCHDEEILLVDGGGGDGILAQIEKAGIHWQNIHDLFITHEHTDHLLGSIVAIRYIGFLMSKDRYRGDFRVYCHQELADKIIAICNMLLRIGEREQFGKRIQFVIIHDGETRNIIGHEFTFFDVQSKKAPQFGCRIQLGNKILTFLGDEPCNESSVKYVQNCDWLLHESFCLYEEREIHTPYLYHHSTVREASELAEKCGVKNLVLWHSEDATWPDRQKRYTAESKQYYSGNVLVPEDLDVINISG